MSKKEKLELIYGLTLTLGCVLCGVGYTARISPWEIPFSIMILGIILFVVGLILFIINNSRSNN